MKISDVIAANKSFSEIVTSALREMNNRGVTFRTYGPNGEFRRMMVHRFPASKLRGSEPFLFASMTESNAILNRLIRAGK